MWLFQHKVFTIIKEIAATFRSNILLMLHLLLKICTINHFCTENQYHIDFLLSTKSLLQGIELVCFASPVDSRCFAEYTQARVHKPNFLLKSLESAAAVAFHTLAQKNFFLCRLHNSISGSSSTDQLFPDLTFYTFTFYAQQSIYRSIWPQISCPLEKSDFSWFSLFRALNCCNRNFCHVAFDSRW